MQHPKCELDTLHGQVKEETTLAVTLSFRLATYSKHAFCATLEHNLVDSKYRIAVPKPSFVLAGKCLQIC